MDFRKLKIITLIITITLVIMTMTACDNSHIKKTINKLTVNVEGEGIIKVGDIDVNSNEEFSCEKGTFATFSVKADENWEFHNWQGENGDDIVKLEDINKIFMNDDKELTAVFVPDHLLGSQQASLHVISLKIEGEKIPLNEPVSHYIAEGKEHDVTAFIHNTGFLKEEGIVTLRIKNNKGDKEVSKNQIVSLAGYSGQAVTFSDVTGNLKEENNPHSIEISTMHGSISGKLYVDGTKPEVNINNVTPEYLPEDGTLTIEYETADDLSGLYQTDITILNNKGETVLIDIITNDSGTLKYACSELDSLIKGGDPVEGSYKIIIETVDKAGNTKRLFMDNAFTVDTTPPEPEITSFNSENPIYINSDTNYLNMNYKTQEKNFASAKLLIDHNRGYILPNNFEYNIPEGPNTIELYICEYAYAPERGYDIELTVTDKAGNKKVVTETDAIIVDNTPPDFPVSIEGVSYSLDDNLLNKKEIADELMMNYDDEIRVHFHNTDSFNHYYPHPVAGDVVAIYSDSDPEINSVQLNSSDIEKGYVDIKIPSNYFEDDGSDDGLYKINAKITDKAGNCNGGINSPYEMRVDTTPPELVSFVATGPFDFVLTMDERMRSNCHPLSHYYCDHTNYESCNMAVFVDGTPAYTMDIGISGSKVYITISTTSAEVKSDSEIHVSYWPRTGSYGWGYNFQDGAMNETDQFNYIPGTVDF